MSLRVLSIIPETMADGPGLRTSVYVAGCNHKCPGCHNPESWNFDQGDIWDPIELANELIKNPYTNITFSGGDPIYQIEGLLQCCKHIKKHSKKNIWVYTGFTYEELLDFQQYRELEKYVDTFVTDPFIYALRDTSLKFRGSSNQRIINIR
jgi:anaerobic ribonucleoside-triphosphate reductase activating protein